MRLAIAAAAAMLFASPAAAQQLVEHGGVRRRVAVAPVAPARGQVPQKPALLLHGPGRPDTAQVGAQRVEHGPPLRLVADVEAGNPTGSVVSYETSVPGVRCLASSRVAPSIQPKSGLPSPSTKSGTTRTIASAPGTASA